MRMYTPPPPKSEYIRLGKQFAAFATEATVRERIAMYFVACGYARSADETKLQFLRGHDAITFMSFSPRGWAVVATVELMPDTGKVNVSAVFEINVAGQVPSRMENRFWLTELAWLEQAVATGIADGEESQRAARLAMITNCVGALTALAICIIVAALSVSLSENLKNQTGKIMFMIGGSAAGLGAAYLTLKYAFGIFAKVDELPFVAQPEDKVKKVSSKQG
jgi:hypothetical protein